MDTQIDRLPPHSMEAEKALLGTILIEPKSIFSCMEKLKAGEEVFYDLNHRTIYSMFLQMEDKKSPISTISLAQHLKDIQQLEVVGGVAYISMLADITPGIGTLDYYIGVLNEKHILREYLKVAAEISMRVYENESEVDELVSAIDKQLVTIGRKRFAASTESPNELVPKALEDFETIIHRQGAFTGMPSGFIDLDKMTWGFQPTDYIVLAARPSVGKSSLMMNIAEHIAVDKGIPVGIFTLEMTSDAIMKRMICSRSRINIRHIRDGFLAEQDFPKLTSAAAALKKAPIYFDASPNLTVTALWGKARQMVERYGIKFMAVDYLQLLTSGKQGRDNRASEISDISAAIKSMAKDLGIPIMMISQLNRSVDKEKNRKPKLSDLRESGSIEQDADLVLLMSNNKEQKEESTFTTNTVCVDIEIAKQRSGPTGMVNLMFLKEYTRFENAAKIQTDDLPPTKLPYLD